MNIDDYQAGHHQQQCEYKSFTPTSINYAWIISDGDILRLLSDADRVLGELNGLVMVWLK